MPIAERFRGIIAFEQCMAGARMTPDRFDCNGDLTVDAPNDPVAVAAVEQALADLGLTSRPAEPTTTTTRTAERLRLVAHPFDRICNGDFGVPGRPDLLPPGGP